MYGVGGYWGTGTAFVYNGVPNHNAHGFFFVYYNTVVNSHTSLQGSRLSKNS